MGILYSKLKIFRYKGKIDSLPKTCDVILPPLHIRLKPTNICNHNCWYCAYRRDNIQLGKDMVARDQIPYKKMLELIGDFEEMGVKAVTFSGGGEPLCYPYLSETLHKLLKTNIKFSCLTNGAKLSGEIADIFAHNGAWIRISLDGWDKKSYAFYRGVEEDEFLKVMNNLENFKRLNGRCYLGVIIVVDKNNAPHVYEIIKNLSDVGVNSVKVSPCIISNDEKESNDYQRPNLETVKKQIERAITDFGNEQFEIFYSYCLQLETFAKDYSWCPYIQINPVIGADLNVYSCHDKAYNLEEGLVCSIKEQRFKDAWLCDKAKFFRINPIMHCKHHCAVNDKNKMLIEYLNIDKDHAMFV